MDSEVTQVIRPWIVETGYVNYAYYDGSEDITWSFDKAFDLESDAKAYAERHAEDTGFIRWGRRK